MAALVGTETVTVATASGSTISPSAATSAAVALLAGAIPARAVNSVTGGVGGTLSAAQIVASVITRTGPVAAFTDTLDTAANIIAALPANTPISTSWHLFIRNLTAYAETLAGGTGVGLAGTTVVPPNSTWIGLVQYTGPTTITVTGLATTALDLGSGVFEPSTFQIGFGAGTGTLFGEGLLNRQISSAGINPGGTAADNVLAVFSLPANSLDGVNNRGLLIQAQGSFAANGNNKRLKVIFNPATAVVGSTVGGGGTTVCDTGTVTTNGGTWALNGAVYKYGAANSNTQITFNQGSMVGAVHQGSGSSAPQLATATENAAILIAITGNATTSASDIVFNMLTVTGEN